MTTQTYRIYNEDGDNLGSISLDTPEQALIENLLSGIYTLTDCDSIDDLVALSLPDLAIDGAEEV